MPKRFPPEFMRDVVTVARRGMLTRAEVVADFDISEQPVNRWMRQADIDDEIKRRAHHDRAVRGRAAMSRQTPPGDGSRDPAAGDRVLRSRSPPKMSYPLVRELAAEGIPVRLTCGVLGFLPRRSTSTANSRSAKATLPTRTWARASSTAV